MTDSKLAPVPAAGYNAWFMATDHKLFPLPIVAMVPTEVYYTEVDDEPSIEWEPAFITYYGSLTTTSEVNNDLPGAAGGIYIGILPSNVYADRAAEILEKHQVMRPDVTFERRPDPSQMVGRVTRARMSVDTFLEKRRAA